jgi:hypothetical protein
MRARQPVMADVAATRVQNIQHGFLSMVMSIKIYDD